MSDPSYPSNVLPFAKMERNLSETASPAEPKKTVPQQPKTPPSFTTPWTVRKPHFY